MAQIKRRKQQPPTEINKFLGVNDTPDGEIGLLLGEATYMRNWRITRNYKLKKREGWEKVFDSLTGDVQGMWYGRLNGQDLFLFCNNGHLYKGNLTNGTKTDLGTLTNAPTRFIPFGTKVYLSNGYEYKSYDGTTFTTVAGYRPKIAIGTPPAGGGELFEQLNVLTGAKHQTFSPDGVATAFQLLETNITSLDFVYINGVLKVLGVDYTVNLTTGIVTFTVAPATGIPDNVDIGWTKGTGQRALIEKCRFSMDYSGKTDSRVFLWGNTDCKNRRFWSGLADGVPSAEYFEANSYSDLGNGQYAITDIVKQYDVQKIYLENSAMYSVYDFTDGIVSFPVYELSDEVGNVAYGQTQIINNSPLTLYKGIRKWEASNVREQFNAKKISDRVQDSLIGVDLKTAITYNWQEIGEYWINVGSVVWIYNYFNDTWYLFDNIDASCFLSIDGELYFGANGSLNKFTTGLKTDNGTKFKCIWEMAFYDFGGEWVKKFMNNIWIGLFPEVHSSVDVQIITNNQGSGEVKTIYYNNASYSHANYAHWSYSTSYNPQPFYVDIQASDFVYFKVVLTNESDFYNATVLSLNLPARFGGKVREGR